MISTLRQTIISTRFLKFCAVGGSGVVVNLAVLWLLSDLLLWNANLSSALAILVSINTNFLMNELWTFRDKAKPGEGGSRWVRFHLVSLLGALIQWGLFVGMNFFWVWLLSSPELGLYKYISQLVGIGVATLLNFLLNFFWTWKARKES